MASEGSASTAVIDGDAHASSLKRLDLLYQAVGKLAANLILPESIARSRQSALVAADKLAHAQASVKEAERARQVGHGDRDVIRLDAQLAQAKTELQQAQVRSEFAYLVLGRDCVNACVELPSAEKLLAEIRRLRQ